MLGTQHRQHPEEQDGQQEVGNRARRDDRDALAHGLAIERLLDQRRRHVTLALVEHLDVTTQRDRSDHELGAMAVMPAQQWRAEAHREAQHLDTAAARHPEVAEFMESDQYTQGYEGADNHVERCHIHLRMMFSGLASCPAPS